MVNFVLGQPRGGKSYVVNALLASPSRITCLLQNFETVTGYQIQKVARDYYEGRGPTTEAMRPFVRCLLRAKVDVECSYILPWMLAPLLEEFPNAKFVHLARDPRGNVRSSYNEHDLYGDFFERPESVFEFVEWSVAQRRPWMYLVHREAGRFYPRVRHFESSWDGMSRLEKVCAFWNEGHRLIKETLGERKGQYWF